MESERIQRGGVWDNSNVKPDTDHIKNPTQRENQIVRILDNVGFNWTVFIAVSAGFLASSYILFSSNIIGPALEYVYPALEHGFDEPGFKIDMVTVGCSTVGMLVFGHLADRLGRKRLYGLELFIIILGTVGSIQSSDGFSVASEPLDQIDRSSSSPVEATRSLNVYAAVTVWRGIQGLGIGAEYPLSAIIAAEFASTQTRGTLIAAMFAMQSLGRVLAYAVTLGALRSVPKDTQDHRIQIDHMWRLVVGISAIPAILAIGLRLTIPETPRYYAGIEKNLKKAVESVEKVGGKPDDLQSIHSDIVPIRQIETSHSVPWVSSAWEYLFGAPRAWRRLVGISVLWFLLDIAFYGLGLDSPATLHRLWLSSEPPQTTNCSYTRDVQALSYSTATFTLQDSITTTITQLISAQTPTATTISPTVTTITTMLSTNEPWNVNVDNRCASITESLHETATRTLLLSSIASVVGSICAILLINRFTRRRFLSITSGVLALFFFVSGFSVWKATETEHHAASMVFFAVSQFMFNLGPNTLIFVIAAESFPTVFRGTFVGIAAATGKLGVLVIRPIMHNIRDDKDSLKDVLFGFCAVMLLIAILSLMPGFIAEIQHPRPKAVQGKSRIRHLLTPLKNKTLEEIAPNPKGRASSQNP